MLHAVDARIKEIWIMAVLLLLARASAPMRAGIALGESPVWISGARPHKLGFVWITQTLSWLHGIIPL